MEKWEREFLRDMAKEKLELSQTDWMKSRVEGWTGLNDLTSRQPMIHFEMGTVGTPGFQYECKCVSGDARSLEWTMGSEMQNYKMVGDDRAVTGDFYVGNGFWIQPFGIELKRTHTSGIGFHIDPVVEDLDNLDFIQPSRMGFDGESRQRTMELAGDIFGDLLEIKAGMSALYCCPTQFVVNMMGMENMFVEMCANPDNFHEMMERLSDDYVKHFRLAEEKGLLLPCCGNNWVAQGSFAFTTALPGKLDRPHRLNEVWGFLDSQETVNISPAMFDEFIFPYYKKIADLYGLLSYGCCEPVHNFWEKSLSRLGNLRKISISPWCDEEYMGEELRKRNIIFQRKPSPLFVSDDGPFDEAAWRAHVTKTVKASCGGRLEFTFRDIYKTGGDPYRPRRAVEIVREVIGELWE
ncbi:MAG: hypothetical protein ACI4V1_01920 [Eubacteriales bacterium]